MKKLIKTLRIDIILRKDFLPFNIIILFYIVSRFILYKYFDIEFVYIQTMHLLDADWINQNLIQSIWYNHSQPPLFNLLYGLSDLIFNQYSKDFFFLFFHLLGILTVIYSYKILRMISVSQKLSLTIVLIYLITPATILYENWFFYTQIVVFLLVFAGYQLFRYIDLKKQSNLSIYLISIVLISLISSYFHILWMIVMVIIPVIIIKEKRITIIKYLLIPFLIVLSVYIKNYFVFDQFSTSSWFGINFTRITAKLLDENLKQKLFSEKRLTQAAHFNGFTNVRMLPDLERIYFHKKTGIKILDERLKSNGNVNYNNIIFVAFSKDALKDDIFVLKNYPDVYLSGVKNAFQLYFYSPSLYPWVKSNREKIFIYNKFFDSFVYGAGKYTSTGKITIVLYPFLILISFFLLFKKNISNPLKIFIIYSLLNILYVMFVGNLFEYGENNRFRFYTEIFYYILIGTILQEIIKYYSIHSKKKTL